MKRYKWIKAKRSIMILLGMLLLTIVDNGLVHGIWPLLCFVVAWHYNNRIEEMDKILSDIYDYTY